MLQNQYVREMRKYGVRGLRYDAAKHSKHEQIERSITPPLKNYNERLHNTKEGANKQVISSQADSLIKISRIWADFFPANTSNQPI